MFAETVSGNTVIVAIGGLVIDTAKVLVASNKGFAPVLRFLETGEGRRLPRLLPDYSRTYYGLVLAVK